MVFCDDILEQLIGSVFQFMDKLECFENVEIIWQLLDLLPITEGWTIILPNFYLERERIDHF